MIHGLDTGFLVAAEVREHAAHADARATVAQVLSAGDVCGRTSKALAAQRLRRPALLPERAQTLRFISRGARAHRPEP